MVNCGIGNQPPGLSVDFGRRPDPRGRTSRADLHCRNRARWQGRSELKRRPEAYPVSRHRDGSVNTGFWSPSIEQLHLCHGCFRRAKFAADAVELHANLIISAQGCLARMNSGSDRARGPLRPEAKYINFCRSQGMRSSPRVHVDVRTMKRVHVDLPATACRPYGLSPVARYLNEALAELSQIQCWRCRRDQSVERRNSERFPASPARISLPV